MLIETVVFFPLKQKILEKLRLDSIIVHTTDLRYVGAGTVRAEELVDNLPDAR